MQKGRIKILDSGREYLQFVSASLDYSAENVLARKVVRGAVLLSETRDGLYVRG